MTPQQAINTLKRRGRPAPSAEQILRARPKTTLVPQPSMIPGVPTYRSEPTPPTRGQFLEAIKERDKNKMPMKQFMNWFKGQRPSAVPAAPRR